MMEEKDTKEVIDLRDLFKKLLLKRKLFFIVWTITFVLSCVIIFPVPRTYSSEVSVAPEASGSTGSSLSSLASSFGFSIGNVQSDDAFYPDIYPDIMATNEFIAGLMTVRVVSEDGEIDTDYYTYMKQYQKKTFYLIPFEWLKRTVKGWFVTKSVGTISAEKIDPFRLTEDQNSLFEAIRNDITCIVDKKTGIITISVVDQDPLICATMADSVRVHLQEFITHYRTNKARIDLEYYEKLTDNAKKEYDESVKKYSDYTDTHKDVLLQAYISERDDMENDMQMKLSTYNAMNAQKEAAKAKIQERTPAFTLLQGATVPVKPAGPKRMIFIAAMLFLSTLGVVFYIFKKEFLSQLTHFR